MRLKKLNTNRRHKVGEDEASGADSEPQNWVSPSKPARVDVGGGSTSGASSPTDTSSVQSAALQQPLQPPHQHLDFQTGGGVGGVAVIQTMDNTAKSSDWREAVDRPVREAVHAKIVEVLQQLKPNAPKKVLERLPGLAYRMEETLLKAASSQAEYSDVATLRQRIARVQETNAKRLLAQQQQAAGVAPQGSKVDGATANMPKPLTEEQARLIFQHLQTWRQKLVAVYGVAPWEILPNQTLAKVALYMPTNEQELAVCDVHNDQLARFGSSLIQELQRLHGSAPSARTKPAAKLTKASRTRRAAEMAKRRLSDAADSSNNKKRKNGAATNPVLAPAAPSPTLNSASLMSPSQMMFRSQGLPDSLPTLLPSTNSSRLSPVAPVLQQPFFSRVQPQPQAGSPSPVQENHMHLLAQGAGQLSKQQQAVKSLEAYEQEVQSLRWMLHQSQQEKSQLEQEVQSLRAQLRASGK